MQESSTTKQEINNEEKERHHWQYCAAFTKVLSDPSTSAHNVEVFGCNASTLCANTVQ
ncbi:MULTISPECIES: hypothetical protein [Lysinibacillus]|uniref:hypothetical protein n=1 Tax=Lysinibacillus TaxID=400634 RepID=UPI00163CA861|nr:hypothetical protein [Lysinibacillus sp. SDF0037]